MSYSERTGPRPKMPRIPLSDAQESIARFIYEARRCAEQELGFAAMLTVFPVILAVAEAIVRANYSVGSTRIHDKDLMRLFAPSISFQPTWLNGTGRSDDQIANKLIDIRDSLVHQISLPADVVLTNTRSDLLKLEKENPDRFIVSTTEFISAVEEALRLIVAKHSTVAFDAKPRTRRAPANRALFAVTSGSAIIRPMEHWETDHLR
jgi:hypothetical protein